MKFSRIFVVAAFLAAPYAFAGDISGFWKHADEPGWIEISLEEGKGTVVRNDKFPERVGREILKKARHDDPQSPDFVAQAVSLITRAGAAAT